MTKNALNGITDMELMHEALARAHTGAPWGTSREQRRAALLARAQLLARRAERKAVRARVLAARVV